MPFVLSGEDKVSRRFWELALLWRLRDGLRSGDVLVEGSRRYADPETYLLTGSACGDSAGRLLPGRRAAPGGQGPDRPAGP